MAKYTPPTKTSDTSCNGSLMLVAFRLGYLQATCNQILTRVAAMQSQQTAPPSGPKSLIGSLRAWAADFLLLHKVWSAWRAIRWPASIGMWAAAGAKWLGWL